MKSYPSVEGPSKAPRMDCVAFYKHDGSNLRWEWRPKTGWSKYGTRQMLFDETHETFGPAIEMFKAKYAEPIEKVIRDTKEYRDAKYATVFTEFFGAKSFAGQHVEDDPKRLVLFDVQILKKGILGPREFIRNFGHLEIPRVVYEGVLNDSFIEAVRASRPGDGKLDLDEGVVCKGGTGHELQFRKIKTFQYLEKLKAVYADGWEKFWE